MNELQLVIFVGLQASGKSTFYRTYFADTHIQISKDLMRNNRKPDRRQSQLIDQTLQAGRSIVIDNTNSTIAERTALIRQGKAFAAQIIGYYFTSNLPDCLERNRLRSGKAIVPEIGVYATAKKLVPPSYDEGFDRLFQVEMTEEGTFRITELT